MDFIQQAMERFNRRPGEDGAGPQRPVGSAPSATPPVVYSSTRTVELADDTMRAQRLITGFEGGPFVDAYKMLRTQVVQQFRQQGWTAREALRKGADQAGLPQRQSSALRAVPPRGSHSPSRRPFH